MNRKVKERSERDRQRAEQEKRKEQEEEMALEQVINYFYLLKTLKI